MSLHIEAISNEEHPSDIFLDMGAGGDSDLSITISSAHIRDLFCGARLMMAVLSSFLLMATCLGGGRAVLRATGVDRLCSRAEEWAIAFVLGFGLLGWLVFSLGVTGHIRQIDLLILTAILSAGLFLPLRSVRKDADGPIGTIILGTVFLAAAFSLLEAVSPPTDADTLAYHFALPKQFLAAGRVEFVPRAVDGAIPLLIQMTYLAALGLGGEMGVTLWTMISGWAVGVLTFVIACRYLPQRWAAVTALIFYTTPAFVYGAGGGQVETRLCLFILVAALAAIDSAQKGSISWAVVAGLAAGFAAGSKYTGLLFVALLPVLLLEHKRRLQLLTVYGVAAGLAGCQWYLWNLVNSGDPIFPLLSARFGFPAPEIWNAAQDQIFHDEWNTSEIATPRSLLWLITYPLAALVAPLSAFEAGRTGFGPWLVLALPFAAMGCWQHKERLRHSSLTRLMLLGGVYYVIWFFVGPSQRVRHLLPLLPLILIPLSVAAYRENRVGRGSLILAVVISLGIQVGGHAFYSLRYARYLLSDESRETFLSQNVSGYGAVSWSNAHLTSTDRLLTPWRPILFHLNVPYYYAHPHLQAIVNLHSSLPEPFLRVTKNLGISHFLAFTDLRENKGGAQGELVRRLLSEGCAILDAEIDVTLVESRTLFRGGIPTKAYVLKLQPEQCIKAQ